MEQQDNQFGQPVAGLDNQLGRLDKQAAVGDKQVVEDRQLVEVGILEVGTVA